MSSTESRDIMGVNLTMPIWQNKELPFFVYQLGFSQFASNLDLLNPNLTLDRPTIEGAWLLTLHARFKQWIRAEGNVSDVSKKEAFHNGILHLNRSRAAAYWRKKKAFADENNITIELESSILKQNEVLPEGFSRELGLTDNEVGAFMGIEGINAEDGENLALINGAMAFLQKTNAQRLADEQRDLLGDAWSRHNGNGNGGNTDEDVNMEEEVFEGFPDDVQEASAEQGTSAEQSAPTFSTIAMRMAIRGIEEDSYDDEEDEDTEMEG